MNGFEGEFIQLYFKVQKLNNKRSFKPCAYLKCFSQKILGEIVLLINEISNNFLRDGV